MNCGVKMAFHCNYCRIKFGIKVDSIWFCDDHVDIHRQENENDDENFD
jgi:hypothetical protein